MAGLMHPHVLLGRTPNPLSSPPSPCSLKMTFEYFMQHSRASKVRTPPGETVTRCTLPTRCPPQACLPPATPVQRCLRCWRPALLPSSPRSTPRACRCRAPQAFTQESLDFQEKVLARSGLGEETYLPECERSGRGGRGAGACSDRGATGKVAGPRQGGASRGAAPPQLQRPKLAACPRSRLLRCLLRPPSVPSDPLHPAPAAIMASPPNICMESARQEANMVLFSSVEEVLKATGTKPQAVDILIVNCSLFNPTPSLSGARPCRACWEGRQATVC